MRLRAIGYWLLAIAPLCEVETLAAQGLPPYAPINPAAASRSGLSTQSWHEPGRKLRVTLLAEYASLIEFNQGGNASYLLDAEVLRTTLLVSRNLGRRGFLLAEGSFNAAHDGFLDGFLDWYHDLIGIRMESREARPRNEFAYEINLQNGRQVTYAASSAFLGDLRIGAGLRHSRHWQSTLSLTLPAGTSPHGFRKATVSVNATTLLRSEFGKRFVYEGTLGAGVAPTRGPLADRQRSVFFLVAQGLRARLTGPLHGYANLIYHSPFYHDTGMRSLDGHELTVDFGGMLRFRRGPEWIFGLTEDPSPSGPAIDVAFRFGARW